MTVDGCACEFDACDCEQNCATGECPESWHYLRRCILCGCEWGALHCPHDVIQNPCPDCSWIGPGKRSPRQVL